MKVLGLATVSYSRTYICEVTHSEIEQFLNLYYAKLPELKIGESVDLGKGYNYAVDIASALKSTRDFVKDNQKVVTAILNGLNFEHVMAEQPKEPA